MAALELSRAILDGLDLDSCSPGQARRLARDAMLYELIIKCGWPLDRVAGAFGMHPKHVRRRIKKFASLIGSMRGQA